MLLTLIVSIYTSRVILSVLGVEDFGIYNIIGGVVVLFSFLTNAMTASTQRYLNYSIGLDDKNLTKKIFNTSLLTHLTISIIVLILSETIGLWFVETRLNIPERRLNAAIWVYHISVATTVVNIMAIPYRSSIIAVEKMSAFAYISIFETVLKLCIVFLISHIGIDRLITYAFLLFIVSTLILFTYILTCIRLTDFTRIHLIFDKKQYLELLSFSGWYLLGGVAMVGSKQGSNILINIFYGVCTNAAVGIANQVRNAIYGFVTNFQTAFNPQIVKLYAIHDYEYFFRLIYNASKLSFFLLFLLSFPIILFCKEVLSMWLVDVPQYSVIFTQLVITTSFTEALSAPLWTAIGAVGKVRMYQLFVSLIILLELPLVYIVFKFGAPPYYAFIINFIVSILAFIYRLIYIKKHVKYSLREYATKVIIPCVKISVIAIPLPLILKYWLGSNSFICTLLLIIISYFITGLTIFIFGLNKTEKEKSIIFLSKLFKR